MISTADTVSKRQHGFLSWLILNRYHLIGWAIFLFYEIVIVGLYTGKFSYPGAYVFHYIINIAIFYIHALWVLKYSLINPKQIFWRMPLYLALEVGAYLLIIYIAYAYINKNFHLIRPEQPEFNRTFFIAGIFRAVYFMIFGTGYYFLITFLKERRKTEELEQQRLNNLIQLAKSEHAFLRAQIQPHLLFNTLDFIYQNAKERSPIAAETIVALSGMMRYAVDSKHREEFIELGEEIEQVENLINLHQLRNNHNLQIQFSYDDEVKKEKIIPMVLVTLVENMFKHGELEDMTSPSQITILKDLESLIIHTRNPIKNKVINHKRPGTGLENIKKRLSYSYGEKAIIKNYFNDNEHFNTKITIKKLDFLKDNP
ncbi:sensor histidine kinase [Pedobacter aquatilis]|uniref:sensor histidine kinase n=1 Tax=Pedobacter aquatilis TaxID=351343 RepID=UPI00292E2BC4|nr:histidine kinase [Pedobacter aquatilis]